ncbi:MAG: RNA polymerase sigma factor [Planctomycetota bacterium]|jgi:RNA polymerase sigma-70 factor (ECF subfamily)
MDSPDLVERDPDLLLMHRVSTGDDAAIEELYDRFAPLVFKVAWQFHRGHAEAEDAVQEIFVRLWQTADRFDPARAKLVTWVMLIARRHLIDRLRRSSVRPRPSSIEGDVAGSDTGGSSRDPAMIEVGELLLERIRDLPRLQREVIERSYIQGYTLREVADQLEAPLGTIKSALSRGLARLREKSPVEWVLERGDSA